MFHTFDHFRLHLQVKASLLTRIVLPCRRERHSVCCFPQMTRTNKMRYSLTVLGFSSKMFILEWPNKTMDCIVFHYAKSRYGGSFVGGERIIMIL